MLMDPEWNTELRVLPWILAAFPTISPTRAFLFYVHPLWPRSADSCPCVNMNACQERLYITWIEADNEQEGRALFNTPSCATLDTSQAN